MGQSALVMLAAWLALGVTGTAAAQRVEPAAQTHQCALADADLAANARLSFDEFDQRGTTPATARQLGNQRCYAEAARATEHYLVNGPILSTGEHSAVVWHLGQYLAAAGDEPRAASVMAAARRPIEPGDELEWNAYVEGTWAFLVKDRPVLETAVARLRAAPQPRNRNNLRAVERMLRCFGRSYADAYFGNACVTESGH